MHLGTVLSRLSRYSPPLVALLASCLVVVVVAALARTTPALAASSTIPTKDLVTTRLLADVSALRPGEPFTLGVLLEVKPGWHVYWQNPGDSGRPTKVKFAAPPGFAVGDLQFPVPEKFTQPDGSVAYGYTHSVLLTARVTPPKEAKELLSAGAKAEFAADVSWLCCADLCVPGKAHLHLEIAASRAGEPEASLNRALFADWEKRVPVPLGAPGAPAAGSAAVAPVTGGLVASADLHWQKPPAAVEFFPAPEEAVKVSDVSITSAGAGETRLRFRIQLLKGQKLTGRSLSTVVACRDGKDDWGGVKIDFPLESLGAR